MVCGILIADLFIPANEKRYTYILTFIALGGTFMLLIINQQAFNTNVAFGGMFIAGPNGCLDENFYDCIRFYYCLRTLASI